MRAFLLIMILSITGCEGWIAQSSDLSETTRAPAKFNHLRMTRDSVVLEIAVARIDRDQLPVLEDLWRNLDTNALNIEQRQILEQNGLRAGLVSSQMPAGLQQLLEPKPIVEEELNPWTLQLHEKGMLEPEPVYLLHDGIQNRNGETHPVPVSETFPEKSWTVKNGKREIAGAGTMVRAVFELKTFPKGDGTVRIVCTPTLNLGQPRTQIGVSQQSFAYETTQDKQRLNDLRFEFSLRNGETILVGPCSDLGDLGGLFFGPLNPLDENSDDSFRILMVRLIQTQLDDLFDANSIREKLSTTSFD